MSDGVVTLLRAGEQHVFRVPAPLPELASVGERWLVGPLLRLQGTCRTSHDLPEVLEAAAHGRVDMLFVTADPWCWEKVAQGSPAVVALGRDDAYADCERVDTAATDTMVNGGQVYVTTQQVAPEGDVAAVLRY